MTPLDRHSRVALHFSGGKDSLAVAHLLRPEWDRLTFYHVDAGDLLPEVREIVASIEAQVPRFVRIESNSRVWMAANGRPADLVPHTGTSAGVAIGGKSVPGRYDCCGANLWKPMHDRMLADGITLVIRGTKRVDMAQLPALSRTDDYEVWLPLVEWSHGEVFGYLNEVRQPVARLYEHAVNAPECATCPAWHSERRAEYLKRFYPALHAEYGRNLRAVAAEVIPVFEQMKIELEAL